MADVSRRNPIRSGKGILGVWGLAIVRGNPDVGPIPELVMVGNPHPCGGRAWRGTINGIGRERADGCEPGQDSKCCYCDVFS